MFMSPQNMRLPSVHDIFPNTDSNSSSSQRTTPQTDREQVYNTRPHPESGTNVAVWYTYQAPPQTAVHQPLPNHQQYPPLPQQQHLQQQHLQQQHQHHSPVYQHFMVQPTLTVPQQHHERYQHHVNPYSHPPPLSQPQQHIYQYQYRPEVIYRTLAPQQTFHHIEKPRQNNAWSYEDDSLLRYLKEKRNLGWREISLHFKNRTANGCQFRWRRLSALEKEKKQRLLDSNKTNDAETNSSTTQAVENNHSPKSTKSASSPTSPRHSLRSLLN